MAHTADTHRHLRQSIISVSKQFASLAAICSPDPQSPVTEWYAHNTGSDPIFTGATGNDLLDVSNQDIIDMINLMQAFTAFMSNQAVVTADRNPLVARVRGGEG